MKSFESIVIELFSYSMISIPLRINSHPEQNYFLKDKSEMISRLLIKSLRSNYSLNLAKIVFLQKLFFAQVQGPTQAKKPTQSPFQNFREHETKTSFQNVTIMNKRPSGMDELLQKYLSQAATIIVFKQNQAQSSKQHITDASNCLWNAYIALKKVVPPGTFNSNQESHQKWNLDIFLPNKLFKKPKLMTDMEVIVSKIYDATVKSQSALLDDLLLFSQHLKTFSKFEKFHENTDYWILTYKMIKEYIDKTKDINQKFLNLLVSLLKTISIRKYYIKHSQRFENKEEKELLKDIQQKIVYLVNQNVTKVSVRGLISLLLQLKQSQDELLEEFFKGVLNRFKTLEEHGEISKCFIKLVKHKKDPFFNTLLKEAKRILSQAAMFNNLSTPDICLILWSLQYSQDELSEMEFSIYWNNFYHNVKFRQGIDYNLFDISTMIKSIVSSKFNAKSKYDLLQECALRALNNLDLEQKKESDGESEEIEEDAKSQLKFTQNLLVSTSCHLLFNMCLYKNIQENNLELMKRLLILIRENQAKVFPPAMAHLFTACAKLKLKLDKLSENERTPKHEEIKNEIKQLSIENGKYITSNYSTLKNIDLIRAFYSFIVIETMTQNLFKQLTSFLISRTPSFNHILYCNLFQLISEMNDLKISYPGLQAFEELMLEKFVSTIPDMNIEAYIGTITFSNSLKNLNGFYILCQTLEGEFMQRIKSMNIKQIGQSLHIFSVSRHISMAHLDDAMKEIVPKFDQADLKDLANIVSAFRVEYAGNPDFYQQLEEQTFKKLKNYISGTGRDKANPLDVMNTYYDFCKLRIEKKELISLFEEFLGMNLHTLNTVNIIFSIGSMLNYTSQNVELLRSLLILLNKRINTEGDFEYRLRTLGSSLLHQLQMIKLEYPSLSLDDYPHLKQLQNKLQSNIGLYKKKYSPSTFQSNLKYILQEMGYSFLEEHEIPPYTVDFFIKPNIVIEANGESHYIPKTNIMTWPTLKKKKILEQMGYRVVDIPYFEWMNIDISDMKFKYLKDKIQA